MPPRLHASVFARLAVAAVALAVALAAACGDGETPVRSPFDDTDVTQAPAASPTPSVTQGIPTPLPTSTPAATLTTTPTPPVAPTVLPTPSDAEREAAIGAAIEAIAEWTAEPQTRFTPELAEPATWPNACLGIERPGVACAEVITPGWRIVLRDALGALHEVRADLNGRMAWAPQQTVRGPVAEVDATTGRLVIAGPAGEVELRAVPGTLGPLEELEVGREAIAGYDASPSGGEAGVIAWVVAA